jgi:hypothetical protein
MSDGAGLERVRVVCPIWFVCSIRPPYRLAAKRRNISRVAVLDNAPAVVREAGATDGSRRFAQQSTRARFATAARDENGAMAATRRFAARAD